MSMNADNPNSDADVSRHYKAIADERVPDELSQQILKMAANDVQSQSRGLVRLWSKPLAWVATIGLSLAVVLELSQPTLLPTPTDTLNTPNYDADSLEETSLPDRSEPPPAAAAPASQPRSVSEDFAPRTQEIVEKAQQQLRLQSGPNNDEAKLQAEMDAVIAPRPDEAMDTAAKPLPDVERERREYAPLVDMSPSDTTAIMCDEAHRADRALWIECIKELRRNGNPEAADQEYKELLRNFPEHPTD